MVVVRTVFYVIGFVFTILVVFLIYNVLMTMVSPQIPEKIQFVDSKNIRLECGGNKYKIIMEDAGFDYSGQIADYMPVFLFNGYASSNGDGIDFPVEQRITLSSGLITADIEPSDENEIFTLLFISKTEECKNLAVNSVKASEFMEKCENFIVATINSLTTRGPCSPGSITPRKDLKGAISFIIKDSPDDDYCEITAKIINTGPEWTRADRIKAVLYCDTTQGKKRPPQFYPNDKEEYLTDSISDAGFVSLVKVGASMTSIGPPNNCLKAEGPSNYQIMLFSDCEEDATQGCKRPKLLAERIIETCAKCPGQPDEKCPEGEICRYKNIIQGYECVPAGMYSFGCFSDPSNLLAPSVCFVNEEQCDAGCIFPSVCKEVESSACPA